MNPKGDKNMTYDMFLNTSHYMKFLMEEIQQMPKDEVPPSIKNISEELLSALKKFVNKFHGQAQTSAFDYEINQTIHHNKNENNPADENTFKKTQEAEESSESNKKLWITEEFKNMIEAILNSKPSEAPTHRFYCRPCNKLINSENSWNKHLSGDKKHLSFMKNVKFKNVEVTCTKCNPSLIVLGSINIMKKYMEYHSGVLHLNESLRNIDWKQNLPKYISIRRVDPPEVGQESRQLSRASSTLSVQSCTSDTYSTTSASNSTTSGPRRPYRPRRSKADKTPKDVRQNVNSQENWQNQGHNLTEQNTGSQDYDNSFNPNQNNQINPTNEGSTNYVGMDSGYKTNDDQFFSAINAMKKFYSENKELMPCHFCLLCKEYFTSVFDWDDHEESEEHKKRITDKSNSDTCKNCLLALFGDPTEICQLLSTVEHSHLDRFINNS